MATRRARIKAIVNVPARRSKANEDSVNIVQTKSLVKKETPSAEPVTNERLASQRRNVLCESKTPDEINGEICFLDPHPIIAPQESSTLKDTNSEINNLEVCAELQPASSSASEVNDPPKNILNDAIIDETYEKATNFPSVSESGPKGIASDKVTDKLDQKRSTECAPISSPLKQRSRLFIRPSPKLVDVGGRGRYPSGIKHKTLSESEDEPKNRSFPCTVDVTERPVPDSSNRTSQSERISDGQDSSTNISLDKTVADNRKNGTVRSGRQRARNKENRASDSRRRLWLQMKKGNGPAGPLDRSRLTMFDYIYYNPASNPMRSSSESSEAGRGKKTSVTNSERSSAMLEEEVDDPGEGNSLEGSEKRKEGEEQAHVGHKLEESGAMPAPRVKVGPDGELIVDEQSLVIATTGLKEGLEDLEKGPALVESSSFTNYATYSKRSKGLEWSENETLRFYRALNVVGTDFSLMQNVLFPNRSRRDLKNKFKREERRNSSLIEKALRNPEMFSSVEELQTEFAKTGPGELDWQYSKC